MICPLQYFKLYLMELKRDKKMTGGNSIDFKLYLMELKHKTTHDDISFFTL